MRFSNSLLTTHAVYREDACMPTHTEQYTPNMMAGKHFLLLSPSLSLSLLFCASIFSLGHTQNTLSSQPPHFVMSSCAVTVFVKHALYLTLNQPLLKLTNTLRPQLTKKNKILPSVLRESWRMRMRAKTQKYSCLGNWHSAIQFYVIYAESCQILQAIHKLFNSFVRKPNKSWERNSAVLFVPYYWCHIIAWGACLIYFLNRTQTVLSKKNIHHSKYLTKTCGWSVLSLDAC